MNNYVFSSKPSFENTSIVMKQPLGFNRNFTTNYISNHVFQKKQSSISSQTQIDSKTDYLTFNQKPTTPNISRDEHQINYKIEYEKLMERHRKKEDKFKKVLFEWQSQLQIKESVIGDCQRELERMKSEPENIAVRQLNKARDRLKEYELALEKSEKARRELEYELEKSRKSISDFHTQHVKEKIPQFYDISKPKQYYVAKLIQCQNALRQREEKLNKLNNEIVHNRSQLQFANKNVITQDKMSLIKALNHKRLIEEDLNKTITRLSNELGQMREKVRVSEESKSRMSWELNDSLKKNHQLGVLNESYVQEIGKLKERESEIILLSQNNSKKQEEIQSFKANIDKLNNTLLIQIREIRDLQYSLSEFKQMYNNALEDKEGMESRQKQQKNSLKLKIEMLQKQLDSVGFQLISSKNSYEKLERELEKERSKEKYRQQLEKQNDEKSILLQTNKKDMKQLKNENDEYVKLISKLNEQNQFNKQALKILQRVKSDNINLQQKIRNLNQQLQNQRVQTTALAQNTLKQNNQIYRIQNNLEQANLTIIDLQQKLKAERLKSISLEQLQKQTAVESHNLQFQLDQHKNKICKLISQYSEIKIRQNQLLEQKQKEDKKYLTLNDSLLALLKQKKALQDLYLQLKSDLFLSKEKISQQQSKIISLSETVHSFEIEQTSFRDSQLLSNSELIALRETNDSLRLKEDEFNKQLIIKDSQIKAKTEQFKIFGEKIESLINKLQFIQQENDILQTENGYIKEKLLESEIQLKSRHQLAESLQIENISIVAKLKDNEDGKDNEMKSMRDLVDQKESENKMLGDKVQELETLIRKIREESEQNAIRLSEELILASKVQEQIEVRLVNSSKLLIEEESKRKDAQKQLKYAKGTKNQNQEVIKNVKNELESALTNNKQIIKKLQQVKKEKTQLQGTISSLRDQIKNIKKSDKNKPKEKKQSKQRQTKQKQKIEIKPTEKSKAKSDSLLIQTKLLLQKSRHNEQILQKQINQLKFLQNQTKQSLKKNQKQKIQFETKVSSLQILIKELTEKIQASINQNEEKAFIIKSLEEQIPALTTQFQEKSTQLETYVMNFQSIESKFKEIQLFNEEVTKGNVELKQQLDETTTLINYFVVKSLVSNLLQSNNQSRSLKLNLPQDKSASVEKHILQLISKIEWMQQNLNFINQENNDLQNELEQKDNQVFDLRKIIEKNDSTIKELKGNLDRANKKLYKNEDLIILLNDKLLELQLYFGNQKYQRQEREDRKNQQKQNNNPFQVEESIEDCVIQSIDFGQQKIQSVNAN